MISVNETLRQTFQENALSTRDDRARVWLNNQLVPHHKMNPFKYVCCHNASVVLSRVVSYVLITISLPSIITPHSLLRLIRRERNALASLSTVGVSSRKAVDLLTDIGNAEGATGTGSDEPQGVFDVRDKSEEKNIIIWINDLGSDQRYKDWNPNLFYIMQPTYNGQFHQIRHNVISSLFTMDLSASKAMEVLSFELLNWVQRMVPFRFGVLPLVRSEDGDGMYNIY